MDPKSSLKRTDPDETPVPPPPSPVDTDDYFELAYEIDEFGVHVPDYLAVR